MGSICYSWDDTPFAWMETPFTWKEACVIQKITASGGVGPRIRKKMKELREDEVATLIGLFVRCSL